jgi:hypothetical protein
VKKALAVMAVMITLAASQGVFARNTNPGVMPPNSKSHGMTYGEWSAKWWQWVYSIPADQHPLNDGLYIPGEEPTGDCSNGSSGQSGSVWFLGGGWSAAEVGNAFYAYAVRDCAIPAGKALFFPIINAECSTLEGNGATEEALRACAIGLVDLAANLTATIDGVVIQDLDKYRAASPLFTFGPLPENNLLGKAPGAVSPAVADGVYLMLPPLSAGNHTIHFAGTVPDFNFFLDITYNLTVGKK